MDEDRPTAHDGTECAGCEWERHPQAFRWFPELDAPSRDPYTSGAGEVSR